MMNNTTKIYKTLFPGITTKKSKENLVWNVFYIRVWGHLRWIQSLDIYNLVKSG